MDWNNIDLTDGSHERDATIIDQYTFENLLLEISCNIKVINEAEIIRQFETSLKASNESAREVFKANLANVTKQALRERERK